MPMGIDEADVKGGNAPPAKRKRRPRAGRGGVSFAINRDQFFDLSTSAFLAIQGIMARSLAPVSSIW